MKQFIKGTKYRKIQVNSANVKLCINCRGNPEFLYNLRDACINVNSTSDIDGGDLKIVSIRLDEQIKDVCIVNILRCGRYGIILNSEFSNLYESYDKPRKFLEHIIAEWKVNDCMLDVRAQFNYFTVFTNDKGYSRADFYVQDNFKDFDVIEKYDFEFIVDVFNECDGKLIFDGESLKAENFLIKFKNKPKVKPFEVELDDIVDHVSCSFAKENNYNIFSIKRLNNGKLQVLFEPKEISDIVYLRALSDISKLPVGEKIITKSRLVGTLCDI